MMFFCAHNILYRDMLGLYPVYSQGTELIAQLIHPHTIVFHHFNQVVYSSVVMQFRDIIIYQDDEVFVVNKPSGLVVHGDGKSDERSLVDMILEEFPEMKDVGEPMEIEHKGEKKIIFRPGIVHRLDRDTSGVMIIARTQESFEFLKKQFQERYTQKIYHAFVYGNIKEDAGVIDAPIGRSASDIRMWSAGRGKRGTVRDAVTHWKVLMRGNEKDDDNRVTYVELSPKTGRTHQLRVHMKHHNTPIVADPIYAPNRPHLLGFSRLALHAHTLTISLLGDKTMTFTAPLPEDFEKALLAMNPLQS
jgi:23S rRNA pseudouridine1911/1915/1917 synthase